MKTAEEVYKMMLAYDDKTNMQEGSPLTHEGVIHYMDVYAEIKVKNLSSNTVLADSLPLAEHCEHRQHDHCDCMGLYCMAGK